ncbi:MULTISPECIES: hypothetical protein [unclassified Streptomyces]|uniref:hypothetical protein n=1 Tax=unclassified Streptomyces TaxID=2593676 RepID=UPI0011AED0F5|nr:hypothetical protein [Streptomyces sp. CB02959]
MRTPHLLALTAAMLATVTGCVSVSAPTPRTAPSGPHPAPSVPERPGARAPSEAAPHEQVVSAKHPAAPGDAAAPEADGAADASAPRRGRHPDAAHPHPARPAPPRHGEPPRSGYAAPPRHHPALGPPGAHGTMDSRMICGMAAGKVRPDVLTLCQGAFFGQ